MLFALCAVHRHLKAELLSECVTGTLHFHAVGGRQGGYDAESRSMGTLQDHSNYHRHNPLRTQWVHFYHRGFSLIVHPDERQ